jgi:hypothetical protein
MMLTSILNMILRRSSRAAKTGQEFLETLKSDAAEGFLQLLLNLMGLVFCLDKEFRRNIDGFAGRYLFCSRDGQISVAAIFNNSRLTVKEARIDDTDVTVMFRNSKALMEYLLSPKPDILGSLLRQDVVVDGNLNYLYKFAYLAKHLQLKVSGQV